MVRGTPFSLKAKRANHGFYSPISQRVLALPYFSALRKFTIGGEHKNITLSRSTIVAIAEAVLAPEERSIHPAFGRYEVLLLCCVVDSTCRLLNSECTDRAQAGLLSGLEIEGNNFCELPADVRCIFPPRLWGTGVPR